MSVAKPQFSPATSREGAAMRSIFFFGFREVKRAVPAVVDLAGKRVARPPRYTVLILLIVLTAF